MVSGWRAIARAGLLGVLVVAPTARAQRTAANTGDRLTGFVLPVEPIQTGISLSALRAWAWTVQDTKRLLLTGGVRVHIGGYELRGDTAVVWINRIPSAQGLINQIAVYFDYVDSPASRSGLGPAPEPGRRRLSHTPLGVTARRLSTKSSMCV